jgi:hypothetical protein
MRTGTRGFVLLIAALLSAGCSLAQPAATLDSSTPGPTSQKTAEPSGPLTSTQPTTTSVPSTPTAAPSTAAPTASEGRQSPTPPNATASQSPSATTGTSAGPKAVFIVGPEEELTEGNLAEAERMAEQAEAAGMDVRRVFFPHATWENVMAAVQGASLVAYLGHGYGWPSNTAKLTESHQDGMGLNSFDGSTATDVTYYGADLIRQNIRLAPHAVVLLMHGCYSAGNGELGAPIPTSDVARERVDNYASGWLAVGAAAVFALQWGTRFNYPDALANTDSTMDELFMSPREYVGWNELYADSARTPAAVSHLDPDPTAGYLRAVTGDLTMTTATWRSGAE